MFGAPVFRHSLWRRANAWNFSLKNPQSRRPIYIINSVNKTRLFCKNLPPTQHHSFLRTELIVPSPSFLSGVFALFNNLTLSAVTNEVKASLWVKTFCTPKIQISVVCAVNDTFLLFPTWEFVVKSNHIPRLILLCIFPTICLKKIRHHQ